MKFGVREICDVVLKAKATMMVGNKKFYKDEPVIYFDTLKTSSVEGASTTVYAQGGRGNARLVAWEGERTVTFTMEDALISPAGFMILSGAGLIESGENQKIYVHTTERVQLDTTETTGNATITSSKVTINLEGTPSNGVSKSEDYIYVMILDDNDDVKTEPYIATASGNTITIQNIVAGAEETPGRAGAYTPDLSKFKNGQVVLVDYYIEKTGAEGASGHARQIDIEPGKFGGNYYLEASTLFRDTNGVDLPAEFIIPNCKIQSNFTFTMASSGDPSTFTFTIDAFPDYTRFDRTKKVLCAIQIVDTEDSSEPVRLKTAHDYSAS